MPTATVQVRQTTTTTTARSAVIVLNTGYLSSRLGILKLLIFIFSLIAFLMILLNMDTYYKPLYHGDRYLLLISFADCLTISIMIVSSLLSLGSATILPKASFDFIFHFTVGILILIGGLWVAVSAFGQSYQRSTYIQVSCVLAILCGIIQIIHGVFSYRLCITN